MLARLLALLVVIVLAAVGVRAEDAYTLCKPRACFARDGPLTRATWGKTTA